MGRIGLTEILLIVGAIIFLFGANKLPEIGSAIGKAIREFKKASKEVENDITAAVKDDHHEKKS